jgi:hypothetical protein
MESARVHDANRKSGVTAGETAHPHRLIVSWRTAIEAAARRADIATNGPYSREDTVHLRRVGTLKVLAAAHPVRHKWLLRRLLLFDKATARGDEPAVQRHGAQMVACWDAVAAAEARGGLQRRTAPPEAAARREPSSQEGEFIVRDRHVELSAGRIRTDVLDSSTQLTDEALQPPFSLSVQCDD